MAAASGGSDRESCVASEEEDEEGGGGGSGSGGTMYGVQSGERARGERDLFGLTCVWLSASASVSVSLSFDRSVCLCGPECLFVPGLRF